MFFKSKYLQKRQVSLGSVLFHWGILLHVWIQNLLKLKEMQEYIFY